MPQTSRKTTASKRSAGSSAGRSLRKSSSTKDANGKIAKAAMSREMLAAGLAAAAAAISASPKARRAIGDAGLEAADTASQAATAVMTSATKLGSLIAEAVTDAAQRIMTGRSSDVEGDSSETSKRSRGDRAQQRSARLGVTKTPKTRSTKISHRIYEETITERINVSSNIEARLVREVEAMVAQSGRSKSFDASKWVHDWIRHEVPALDGERPIDLLDTEEGRELVSTTLARMQSGAYA